MDTSIRKPVRRWLLPTTLVAVLVTVWLATWILGRRHEERSPSARPPPAQQYERHYVSPQQLAAAGGMSSQSLDQIPTIANDGKRRTWDELSEGNPVVVVFIKRGCPCSVEFEPFFHRLFQAYRNSVRFIGVIDGDEETARRYAEDNRVPYLVLSDPAKQVITCFGAKNGAYVALTTPHRVIDTLWPGCSEKMMLELSQRMAHLAGIQEEHIDTSGLPNALTTGCPFAE